jgi:hypothetical protein
VYLFLCFAAADSLEIEPAFGRLALALENHHGISHTHCVRLQKKGFGWPFNFLSLFVISKGNSSMASLSPAVGKLFYQQSIPKSKNGKNTQ